MASGVWRLASPSMCEFNDDGPYAQYAWLGLAATPED